MDSYYDLTHAEHLKVGATHQIVQHSIPIFFQPTLMTYTIYWFFVLYYKICKELAAWDPIID